MRFFSLLKQAYAGWSDDHASRLGAALAYYAVFSFAPLLVIAAGVLGLVYQGPAAQHYLLGQLQQVAGADAAAVAAPLLQSSSQQGSGVVAIAIGSVTALLGAAGIFGQLKEAANAIWKTEAEYHGLRGALRKNLILFALLGLTGAVILASLALNAAAGALHATGWTVLVLGTLISFLGTALLFALLFKTLPDHVTSWRGAWVAGLLTALLFAIGRLAIGLYLAHASLSSTYGAAGSLAALLVWAYYAAQIFLYGIELHQVLDQPATPSPSPTVKNTGLIAVLLAWLWYRRHRSRP